MQPNIWSAVLFQPLLHINTTGSENQTVWSRTKTCFSHSQLCSTSSALIVFPLKGAALLFSWHLLVQQLARLHGITLITQTLFKAVHSSRRGDKWGSLCSLLGDLRLSSTSQPAITAKSNSSRSLTSYCPRDLWWILALSVLPVFIYSQFFKNQSTLTLGFLGLKVKTLLVFYLLR